MPDIFAIVFDGWTTSDSHDIAMYATFAHDCTRGFTEMYRELYGLSYPGIMWPLPSEARVWSEGTRIAFSDINGESIEGMKSNL